jgi:hypothetical protein
LKILFITSGLEPGKDGVGDYTRLLATECQRQGHACRIIAFSDSQITLEKCETQSEIETLRLGKELAARDRVLIARGFISQFVPDWVSLQFVSYGFHPKGIVLNLADSLSELIGCVPLHIMFHELWIGANRSPRLIDGVVGRIQKYFILRLVECLSPRIVQTSNPVYVHLLRQNAIHAERLKLFGAIPTRSLQKTDWLFSELQQSGSSISNLNREQFWLFGFFGTLHPAWQAEPFFRCLREASKRYSKNIILLAIGRLGTGRSLWTSLSRKYSTCFQFLDLGERSALQISEFFDALDFGIATTPYSIIGKSATASAMIEHGLPVIVTRDELRFDRFEPSPNEESSLFLKLKPTFVDDLVAMRRESSKSLLPEVASQFLEGLRRYANSPSVSANRF